MDARMLYLHALSRIHSGTGQSTDVIDLPIARERVYGWPYLPASSIKGVLRDAADPGNGDDAARRRFEAAFGPPTQRASEGAGQLWFTDAHLLCLPVRSVHGVFAWVSCPLALRRWHRDHERAGLTSPAAAVNNPPSIQQIFIAQGSALAPDEKVYLEDYDLDVDGGGNVDSIASAIANDVFDDDVWRQEFHARFGVVHDDLFTVLSELSTEVDARTKLDSEKKTVTRGALWYEESAPAESIFACPVLAAPRNGTSAAELFAVIDEPLKGLLQIGGNASVGRGLVEARLRGQPAANTEVV